ncbi:hotdog fold thioesterase [Peribacillus loiseleuriae]|uniref:hotdog fold thioesterase n=1 Tax=Peribacillus loiseleuriae TaxID=1679170 RepID=UPI000B290AE2
MDALRIEIVEVSNEKVVARCPFMMQPDNTLDSFMGSFNSETVASVGSWNLLDMENEYAIGLEISANHIRGESEGTVKATGFPIHKTTMVWEIQITDENDKPICFSRCTTAVNKRIKKNNS